MNRDKFVSISIGTISMAGLFIFYVLTMKLLAGSWDAVWWQFRQLWYLMLPLIAGFGIQICLFSYIKLLSRSANNKMMAASSATSAVSMVACCAHHAVDIVPLLGISALSLWLTVYQKPLLIIGILSNFVGITYLLRANTSLFLDKPKVV